MTGISTDHCTTCGGGDARHVVDGLPYCRICCTRCAAKWAHFLADRFDQIAASHPRGTDRVGSRPSARSTFAP